MVFLTPVYQIKPAGFLLITFITGLKEKNMALTVFEGRHLLILRNFQNYLSIIRNNIKRVNKYDINMETGKC